MFYENYAFRYSTSLLTLLHNCSRTLFSGPGCESESPGSCAVSLYELLVEMYALSNVIIFVNLNCNQCLSR